MDVTPKSRTIFDPIYGLIRITPLEWEVIHSCFYQRLRWIKQLGLSCYLFHGAEHSRFGHSIGVMFNAHKILQSCGKAVDEEDLIQGKLDSKEAIFHQSLRLGALLHDIGTFPFSHTTEGAYIDFAETTRKKGGKGLIDDHENLGSFIIKNTNGPGGITEILTRYGIDPQDISDLVKGVHSNVLANQILHSEIDCDRMDYLLRDAHYTGLKYGHYDREYLLYHFRAQKVAGKDILTIRDNALHCVEDFLMARFAWYSQVIRSPRGAKYDTIAEKVCYYLLEKGHIYRYSEILEMAQQDAMKFYGLNDQYFMQTIHSLYTSGGFDKRPDIKAMAKILLLGQGGKAIKCEEFKQRLLSQDDSKTNDKHYKKAISKAQEIQDFLQKEGSSSDWSIFDIPKKDIVFAKSVGQILDGHSKQNVLLERDPVKISYDEGDVKLLAQVENSFISELQKTKNFIPNAFCSDSAYEKLIKAKIIPQEPNQR